MITQGQKIVYVTREIERALGVNPSPDYHVISNKTGFGEEIKRRFPEYVTLIDPTGPKLLGTGELLSHKDVQTFISETNSAVVVFKNTARIEPIIKQNNWTLLNPKAYLSEKIENKISQVEWLPPAARDFLPPHSIKIVKEIIWENKPFILQWAHGHTGDGTKKIESEETLNEIKAKFPERISRVTEFVHGPSFTVNAVVSKNRIVMGNISYQITGIKPFTDNEFSTIGNDWAIPHSLLNETDLKNVEGLIFEIGSKMQRDGWLGLFGIDFMRDDTRNCIVLIEINARQPASTTYESFLQERMRKNGIPGMTAFEAHLSALQGFDLGPGFIEINDGAQIVQRQTKDTKNISRDAIEMLSTAGYNVIEYNNEEDNSDLIRIQSDRGIIEGHNKFNVRGKEIMTFCHTII